MLFSNEERVVYDRPPLHEVICQIRFPDILTIEAKEPADFQEAIRADFPRYLLKKDQPAPKITGFVDGIPQVDRPGPITNYHFVSADNMWKLNLTRNFIALSTLRYTCWEDFAKMLDKPDILEVVSRKAGAMLNRPVRAVVVDMNARPAGNPRMEQLMRFGREHSDIINIKNN